MTVVLVVLAFALAGAPVFVVMAGATILAWLTHPNESMHFVRFLAPDVLDDRFTGNSVLVTVPLFTFVGYLMAQSKAPERIVRASNAFLGWLPGGLAIVCIVASAFFTTLCGGSAVTIVAIGALLYPALLERGYPKEYALGLVMTGGSLGLLLPPSVPVVVYSIVAGVDFTMSFKALFLPGVLVLLVLCVHAGWIATRLRLARQPLKLREMASALWLIKWELGIPVLILGGFVSGLASIDEVAALAAAYVIVVEVWLYRDVPLRKLPRIIARSMALAGEVMLIMAMASAFTNYVVSEQIPTRLFEAVTESGMTEPWQFLIVLNVFLYIVGMFIDGFSSILIAVPLLIPFAAKFMLSPFHLAAMFLLNLEIAYLSPPLGQNLFVTSFRFNEPMVRLFRVTLPFLGLLTVSLAAIMIFPSLSTIAIKPDIERAIEAAKRTGEPPLEAYTLTCVQEDRNDPKSCDPAERARLNDADDEGYEELGRQLMGTGAAAVP